MNKDFDITRDNSEEDDSDDSFPWFTDFDNMSEETEDVLYCTDCGNEVDEDRQWECAVTNCENHTLCDNCVYPCESHELHISTCMISDYFCSMHCGKVPRGRVYTDIETRTKRYTEGSIICLDCMEEDLCDLQDSSRELDVAFLESLVRKIEKKKSEWDDDL